MFYYRKSIKLIPIIAIAIEIGIDNTYPALGFLHESFCMTHPYSKLKPLGSERT